MGCEGFALRIPFNGLGDSFAAIGGGVASDSMLSQSISSSSSSSSDSASRRGPRPLCGCEGAGRLTCLFWRFFSTRSALRLSLRFGGPLRGPFRRLLFAGSADVSTETLPELAESITELISQFHGQFGPSESCAHVEMVETVRSQKSSRSRSLGERIPASPLHTDGRGHPTIHATNYYMARAP